jgi:hypothetical protein
MVVPASLTLAIGDLNRLVDSGERTLKPPLLEDLKLAIGIARFDNLKNVALFNLNLIHSCFCSRFWEVVAT